MKRKMQICGPKCSCGAFRHLVNVLRKYGIEPAIKTPYPPAPEKEESRIVLFETPLNWSIQQLRDFNIELWNSELITVLPPRVPCYVCLSRDWQICRQLNCSFCDDTIHYCKECWESFVSIRDYLDGDGEPRCHDCKNEEYLDTTVSPSLVALVWKEVEKVEAGVTSDEIKARINERCVFDGNANQIIESAIFDCMKHEFIVHKNGRLFFNDQSMEDEE